MGWVGTAVGVMRRHRRLRGEHVGLLWLLNYKWYVGCLSIIEGLRVALSHTSQQIPAGLWLNLSFPPTIMWTRMTFIAANRCHSSHCSLVSAGHAACMEVTCAAAGHVRLSGVSSSCCMGPSARHIGLLGVIPHTFNTSASH